MAKQSRIVMLSVGISEYQHPGIADLSLSVADAQGMAQAIVNLGRSETLARVLLNERATKANMQAGIAWLADNVGPEDLAILYYSGHGARFEDQDSDEEDNYDEFLCPCDTGMQGGVETFIRDDEMREWIKGVTARTSQFAILLDSCHSGDAVRLGEATPKQLPRELVEEMLHGYKRPSRLGGLFAKEKALAGHMLLAAAEAQQSSYEIRGMANGLFTTYLLQGLADRKVATFTALFKFAQEKVEADTVLYKIQQNPHLIPREEGDLSYR